MFLDESGFLLIPTVTRTWAPRGQTPFFYHLYKRDRISAFSALAVSPQRKHITLYLRFRQRNLNGLDVRAFLKYMLQHVRGPIILLWDQGTIHRRREVKAFLRTHPRLQVEAFPGYAPELNPAEYVWTQSDHALANSAPVNLPALHGMLRTSFRRIRRSQRLLWSCIFASNLPWTR